MSAKKSGGPLIGDNRKARHIYEYLETIEAGISLTGPEVKSLRAGQVNFTDSYVEFRRGEAWLRMPGMWSKTRTGPANC